MQYLDALRDEVDRTLSRLDTPPRGRGVRPTRRRIAIAAIGIAAVCGSFLVGVRTAPSAQASTASVLQQIAQSYAETANDPSAVPTGYVETSSAAALQAVGRGSTDSQNPAVYLVIVSGHFSSEGQPLPAGAEPATGTTLALLIREDNYQVVDMAILHDRPSTVGLGVWHSM